MTFLPLIVRVLKKKKWKKKRKKKAVPLVRAELRSLSPHPTAAFPGFTSQPHWVLPASSELSGLLVGLFLAKQLLIVK